MQTSPMQHQRSRRQFTLWQLLAALTAIAALLALGRAVAVDEAVRLTTTIMLVLLGWCLGATCFAWWGEKLGGAGGGAMGILIWLLATGCLLLLPAFLVR